MQSLASEPYLPSTSEWVTWKKIPVSAMGRGELQRVALFLQLLSFFAGSYTIHICASLALSFLCTLGYRTFSPLTSFAFLDSGFFEPYRQLSRSCVP
ncbi:hypothetical protein P168DRAFT_138082 [Aspergillus campestris IBT 28561]|uniref:Uncharacterized protein n=1 Tax=Aspergillus campestris (strain IBT 28561) TaxID=1392248 RepID=A0A2I1D4B6_ASPC2|nr:uncharacterized protein P168DRAFT_138082 [Aspergillus campestris IBT 28561]PKY04721.1 hypothetical protein P168DRAFT_138082 [Aspergillus campestris IBT 28561]